MDTWLVVTEKPKVGPIVFTTKYLNYIFEVKYYFEAANFETMKRDCRHAHQDVHQESAGP